VAEFHSTGVPVRELDDLMASEPSRDWRSTIGSFPSEWTERQGRLFRTPELARQHDPSREELGARFLREAEELVGGPLRHAGPLVRFYAVTGSVAFGEPVPGDDLDFFVITRSGAVWPFLLYVYLVARFGPAKRGASGGPSHWCFNYILDERAAAAEFSTPQGFQFAREALTLRPLRGASYYRGLLGRASWMGTQTPKLYERWAPEARALPERRPAPWPIRLLNRILHPVMATYLQLVALRDNHTLRRDGSGDSRFDLVTRSDRLEVRSDKYAKLASNYPGSQQRSD
jgi:hypothetical protein